MRIFLARWLCSPAAYRYCRQAEYKRIEAPERIPSSEENEEKYAWP